MKTKVGGLTWKRHCTSKGNLDGSTRLMEFGVEVDVCLLVGVGMLVMHGAEVKRMVCKVSVKIPGVSETLLAVVMATVAVLTSIEEKALVEIMKMGQRGKKPWMTCETTLFCR